ncbi:TPA: hypothetical protein H1009_04470, partial [archaeon]|nr:hypothetical protein [Candidatus Naiadarchaeales archaeon SRR2090153.bin461]
GRIYVDGNLSGTRDSFTFVITAAEALKIGVLTDTLQDVNFPFTGDIDDVMIFNKSLSTEQVYLLYTNRTNIIALNETSKNETWQACITPNDGFEDGTQVCSNSITILNAKPTQGLPILNATDHPLNRTEANLTVYLQNVQDIDGDGVRNITDWRVNGTSLAVLNMPFETDTTSPTLGVVRDYSMFGNNGTLQNGPTWNSSGQVGGAYRFDGVNDFINVGNPSVMQLTTPFTIEAWVRPDSIMSNNAILGKYTETDGSGYMFYIAGGALIPRLYASNGASDNVQSNVALALNGWNHLVGVWNGASKYIYVNGTLRGSNAQTAVTASSINFTIGTYNLGGARTSFNGSIDEVRVYNRSFSPQQVYQLYLDGNRSHHLENVHFNETTIDDVWQACVTPNDGSADGNTSCSVNLTIRANAKPVVDTVVLNSTDLSTNNTNVNLTLFFNATDAEGDSIKNITNWFRNSTSITVLHMPFEKINNTDSNNAWDYSGYGNNGSEQGGVVWNATGGYDGRGAYKFDGSNDQITAGAGNSLGLTTAGTIAAWVKTPGTAQGCIVCKRNSDSLAGIEYGVFVESALNITINHADGVAGEAMTTTGNISTNTWYHIVNTWNAGTWNVYINGQLNKTEAGHVNPKASTNPLRIGAKTGSAGFFTGDIDDVLIFNRSLSPEQIYLLFINRTNIIALNETSKNETWQACITPNDGFEDGAQVCSNNITILNIPPIVDTVVLNTTDVTLNQTDQNLTLYFNTTDIDADGIKNITTWTVNSNPFAVVMMPFEQVNNTGSNNAYDYSDNRFSGTETGCSGSCLPVWVASAGFDNRSAYRFNGSNYLDLGDKSQLDFVTYKMNFTVAFWMNVQNADGACRRIFTKREESSPHRSYALALCGSGDNALYWQVAKNGSTGTFLSNSRTAFTTYNAWRHIALVWKDVDDTLNITEIYLDGVKAATTVSSLTAPTNDNFRLSGDVSQATFNGTIDEFMIFNRSLSYQQIANIFRNTTKEINFNETQTNDVWQACVVPHDGTADGSQACSNSVTILSDVTNTLPTAPVTGNPFNG